MGRYIITVILGSITLLPRTSREPVLLRSSNDLMALSSRSVRKDDFGKLCFCAITSSPAVPAAATPPPDQAVNARCVRGQTPWPLIPRCRGILASGSASQTWPRFRPQVLGAASALDPACGSPASPPAGSPRR